MQREALSTYGSTKASVGQALWQASQVPQRSAAGRLGGRVAPTRISPRKNQLPAPCPAHEDTGLLTAICNDTNALQAQLHGRWVDIELEEDEEEDDEEEDI